MKLTEKHISRILLVSYLLYIVHSGFSHCHLTELCEEKNHRPHDHKGFDYIHHDHDFHVGVFHFLEHLFENVEHVDHLSHDHLTISQANSIYHLGDKFDSSDFYALIHYYNDIIYTHLKSLHNPELNYLASYSKSQQKTRGPPLFS